VNDGGGRQIAVASILLLDVTPVSVITCRRLSRSRACPTSLMEIAPWLEPDSPSPSPICWRSP
jgi:hypothetical protein